jgi:hypothetical protein
MRSEAINIPVPDSSDPVQLTIGFGAGELKISPGAQDALVEGTAEYNVADLKPETIIQGNQITLKTGDLQIEGLPVFGRRYKNAWDLRLGNQPMELIIDAGAYQGNSELGGLSLNSLSINDGASDAEWSFTEPNLVDMDLLQYKTGASSVELNGLANARADEVNFKGGAGNYILDFSGQLEKDMDVSIDAGISNVEIVVPQGVSAQLTFEGGLSNVNANGDWQKSGSVYLLEGEGPQITFNVTMGAGNLELRNR